jgi:hypothetical protein
MVLTVPIPKTQIVQEDQPYANLVYSEQEGVLYNPNLDLEDQQDAYFTHNMAPPITKNFAWDRIKINWTRNYTSTPTIFEALFSIEGILLDGTQELLGEQIITDISASEVTDNIIFDLLNNRSTPSFRKINGSAPSGKIQLNLPMRWLYFDSIDLVRSAGSISPDTPDEDDTTIYYTVPGDYTADETVHLKTTPLNHSYYETNDLTVTPENVLILGYNAVDRFSAIKLKFYLQADTNCNVRINSAEYRYTPI